MTNTSNNEEKRNWTPDKYFQLLQDSLEAYENEHPHWQIEVLFSIIKWSLRSLKHYIEDRSDSDISWESPFVELHYPVEWNWEVPRVSQNPDLVHSGMIFGTITKENTSDKDAAVKTLAEIMVGRLNTLALGAYTNGAWYEIKNNYYLPILPIALSEELNAIKNKREQREFFEEIVRPFSIGAALIDYSGMEFRDGARVPKRVAKQLANIDNLIDIKPIGISGDINGRKIEMSLVFQIHPLIADYDKKKAYHPITIGLFFKPKIEGTTVVTITPSDWPKADREALWRELLHEIDKIVDNLIPKTERQTSEILSINARLEVPLTSSHPDESNAAIKKIFENLSLVGKVREISVRPAENISAGQKELQPKEGQTPETFQDMVRVPILQSRFRWPIGIIVVVAGGLGAAYAILPDEVKLQIWNYFVSLFHRPHGN